MVGITYSLHGRLTRFAVKAKAFVKGDPGQF
jgi:hypothetical protein